MIVEDDGSSVLLFAGQKEERQSKGYDVFHGFCLNAS